MSSLRLRRLFLHSPSTAAAAARAKLAPPLANYASVIQCYERLENIYPSSKNSRRLYSLLAVVTVTHRVEIEQSAEGASELARNL
jgi:hypothetical protein